METITAQIFVLLTGDKHGGERDFFTSFEALREAVVELAQEEESPGALLASMADSHEKLEAILWEYSHEFHYEPLLGGVSKRTSEQMYAYCWSEDTSTAVMDWAGVRAEALSELEDCLAEEELERLEREGTLEELNEELANYSQYDSFIQAITV